MDELKELVNTLLSVIVEEPDGVHTGAAPTIPGQGDASLHVIIMMTASGFILATGRARAASCVVEWRRRHFCRLQALLHSTRWVLGHAPEFRMPPIRVNALPSKVFLACDLEKPACTVTGGPKSNVVACLGPGHDQEPFPMSPRKNTGCQT